VSDALLLSIDPGLRGCGCAWWTKDAGVWSLHSAAYVSALSHEPEDKDDDGPVAWNAMVGAVELAHEGRFPSRQPTVLVVERMKVYVRSKGDPRDLLALSAIGGALFRAFHEARPVGVLPATWKGQVPRDVMGARVERKVRDARLWEKVEVPRRKTHLNDVMHAVGLGLYFTSRDG
jgi:hypothetical protein